MFQLPLCFSTTRWSFTSSSMLLFAQRSSWCSDGSPWSTNSTTLAWGCSSLSWSTTSSTTACKERRMRTVSSSQSRRCTPGTPSPPQCFSESRDTPITTPTPSDLTRFWGDLMMLLIIHLSTFTALWCAWSLHFGSTSSTQGWTRLKTYRMERNPRLASTFIPNLQTTISKSRW